MAVCKRCGKSFDYNKRDGVCPKCCFYNRPEGTWQEDDSWIKNYNYEDNSYEVNYHEEKEYVGRETIFGKDADDIGAKWQDALKKSGHREVSGSHKHTSDGKILRGSSATTKKSKKSASNPQQKKKGIGCVGTFIIIFWIYAVIAVFLGFLN